MNRCALNGNRQLYSISLLRVHQLYQKKNNKKRIRQRRVMRHFWMHRVLYACMLWLPCMLWLMVEMRPCSAIEHFNNALLISKKARTETTSFSNDQLNNGHSSSSSARNTSNGETTLKTYKLWCNVCVLVLAHCAHTFKLNKRARMPTNYIWVCGI